MPYFPLRVSIPEPCHENWHDMDTVDDKRRHCAACDRTLTDFSRMSDAEIYVHLRRHEGKLCGRFRKDQLERKIHPHPPRRLRGLRALAASAAVLLTAPVFGQRPASEPTEQSANPPATATRSTPRNFTLRGKIRDAEEPDYGLIGATVLIKGTTRGTVTDIDGNFALEVTADQELVLVISYTGFSTREVTFSPAELRSLAEEKTGQRTDITLDVEASLVGYIGVVVVASNSKPTLLENLMNHKIFSYSPDKPADYYRGKTGDWKDYWRELFARRKARRAQRRTLRNQARAERRAHLADGDPNPAPASAPTPLTENIPSSLQELSVSPNPFRSHLSVSLDLSEASTLDFALLDASGRLILRQRADLPAGKQSITLDRGTDKLVAGTYFLRVLHDGELLKTITLQRQ